MAPDLSRRTFLAGAAAAGLVTALPTRADADEYSPALVIGSGFGGAVTALRLGRAGVGTIVIERGRQWPRSAFLPVFSNEQLPDGRAFWFKDVARFPSLLAETPIARYAGVMDASWAGNLEVFRGAAVGGGSIVYSGVSVLPARKQFEAIFPAALSYDDFVGTWAPRVKAMLGFSTVPSDLYASPTWTHARVWDAQARKAGFTPRPLEVAFDWPTCRQELALQSRPSVTIGESNFGVANGGKSDLTQNYLPAATATGKVRIDALTVVSSIAVDDDGRYVVLARRITPTGGVVALKTYVTDRLFLAGGSMGTSELLVRARDTDAMPRLGAEIGQGWGTNGDTVAFRSLNGLTGVAQAGPSPSGFHDDSVGVPTTVESWFIPHPVENTGLATLGIGVDLTHRGTFSYDSAADRVDLHWDTAWDQEVVETHRRINARIAEVSGAVAGYPGFRPEVVADFTAHPLGGAVIGRATDMFGRVKGHRGLYVNDGALIPGSTGGANPSLPIAALAERNMARIIAQDF
jgi:cholesterol oxidase